MKAIELNDKEAQTFTFMLRGKRYEVQLMLDRRDAEVSMLVSRGGGNAEFGEYSRAIGYRNFKLVRRRLKCK